MADRSPSLFAVNHIEIDIDDIVCEELFDLDGRNLMPPMWPVFASSHAALSHDRLARFQFEARYRHRATGELRYALFAPIGCRRLAA